MSIPLSLLRRSSCSAIAHHRGQAFFSQDAMKLLADLKPWGVKSDATPDVDTRSGGLTVKTRWTNIGAWTDAALKVTHPYPHRLEVINPAVTLVLCFPKKREWGFYKLSGWVPHGEYKSDQEC